MSWGPIDPKYLTPVDMSCYRCSAVYVAYMTSYQIGQIVLTVHYSCACGSCYGRVIGPSKVEEQWPEFIDA